MAIKENDFIELNYTGKVKDSGIVFDTTVENDAKAGGIFNDKQKYKPVIICVGRAQILRGLDMNLLGKEISKRYKLEIRAEDSFGKKKAEFIQLVPTSRFRKDNVNPEVGLQVQIDNAMGIVKHVSGGRTLVDFNHPLAGKDLVYDIEITRQVTDLGEKVKAFVTLELGFAPEISVTDKDVEISLPLELPKEASDKLTDNLKTSIPELGKVSFKVKANSKK